MSGNSFLDSNVCLYILDRDHSKFLKSKSLLVARPTISTQVVLENISVCVKRLKKTRDFAIAHAQSLQTACRVKAITSETMLLALHVFEKYGYSIFDSVILAAALESGCDTLYSEDMQHGQLIEGKLRIINPFR
jgi:predicted nucleic acid-binding protein